MVTHGTRHSLSTRLLAGALVSLAGTLGACSRGEDALGPSSKAPSLEMFIKLTRDADPQKRCEGARWIEAGAPGYRGGVPALVELLADPSDNVAAAAIAALAAYPGDLHANVHLVTPRFAGRNLASRLAACAALRTIDHSGSEVLSWLVEGLNAEDPEAALEAVAHLRDLGPRASPCADALRAAVHSRLPVSADGFSRTDSKIRIEFIEACRVALRSIAQSRPLPTPEVSKALALVNQELQTTESGIEAVKESFSNASPTSPSREDLFKKGAELQSRRDQLLAWRSALD